MGRLHALAREVIHGKRWKLKKGWMSKGVRLLISPLAYARAEQTYGEHVGILATELAVTETIARAPRVPSRSAAENRTSFNRQMLDIDATNKARHYPVPTS